MAPWIAGTRETPGRRWRQDREAEPANGYLVRVWTGATWEQRQLLAWTGSAWSPVSLERRGATAWEPVA